MSDVPIVRKIFYQNAYIMLNGRKKLMLSGRRKQKSGPYNVSRTTSMTQLELRQLWKEQLLVSIQKKVYNSSVYY